MKPYPLLVLNHLQVPVTLAMAMELPSYKKAARILKNLKFIL